MSQFILKYFFLASIFTLLVSSGNAQNENIVPDSLVEVAIDPDIYNGRPPCFWPHSNTESFTYRTFVLSRTSSGSSHYRAHIEPIKPKEEKKVEKQKDYSSYNRQFIDSKKKYRSLFGKAPKDIDWKTEKVLILTESITYKFGRLNSDHLLLGLSQIKSSSKLLVGYKGTFHGVCQGLAQPMEAFSSETVTYAMIIPKVITDLEYYHCHEGPDCSDIP